MKSMISLLLALALCLGIVPSTLAEAITLADLQATIPERLQMTVTTDAGETLTVDAPITLPDANTMPILQAKYMLMDTSDLREKYPIEKGTPSYVRIADAANNFVDSPLISYYVGSANALDGKTDYSTRAVLAPGETPPENDMTLDQVLAIVYDRIAEFGGDPSVDLRVYRANAMSGLYRMKMVKVEDADSGVSYKMPAIDPQKPIKKQSKGIWDVRLTQYFHGIPVFPIYYRILDEGEDFSWPYPVLGSVRMLNESTMSMAFSCCEETGVLVDDAPLAPFAEVERAIAERMQAGQLRSVYRVSLGYAVKIAKGDSFSVGEDGGFNTDARFVLIPVWQICGYDLKDRDQRHFQGFTEPSEAEVMQRLDGGFELWIDAVTAQPVTSCEYDLEANAQ